MERYEKYKDSGVEWIGEIPDGWNTSKLNHSLLGLTDGSHVSVKNIACGKSYVTVNDVDEKTESIDLENCKKISEEDFTKLVRNGCQPKNKDILFSQIGTIGRVIEVQDSNFVCLSSLAILTPDTRKIVLSFLMHYLRSEVIKKQYEYLMAGSAVKRITLNHISNFIFIQPPISEQTIIANYLDRKTSEIDELVAQKEHLLSLYEE